MGFLNKILGKDKKEKNYTPPVTSATGKIELEVPDDIFKDEYRKKSSTSTKKQPSTTKNNPVNAPKAAERKKASLTPKKTKSISASAKNAKSDTKNTAESKVQKSTKQVTKQTSSKNSKNKKPEKKQAMQSKTMQKSKDESSYAGGYFEIKTTKDERYVFNLYASNHLIIATSQAYSSVQSALTGIKSVMANANAPIEDQTTKASTALPYPKWEIYLDSANEYRFRLSASNGYCVCHSQGYNQKSSCKNGIKSIQKFAPTAVINKDYLKKK